MAHIGYARVSSVGQSLEIQLDKLTYCDRIYQEKRSGSTQKRPRLDACLDYVWEGDTLVATRLDRLARSTLHLCQIAAELQRKQVHLQVLASIIKSGRIAGWGSRPDWSLSVIGMHTSHPRADSNLWNGPDSCCHDKTLNESVYYTQGMERDPYAHRPWFVLLLEEITNA